MTGASLDIIDSHKAKVGSFLLNDFLLEKKVNKAVLYEALRANLSSKHHGTVNTKTRSEVLRTTRKIYRQKGTGNARHGSRKSSPFVGGGRVFGPHQRDYTIRLNRQTRQLALREALRASIKDNKVIVVSEISFDKIKTRQAADFFKGIDIQGGLVVLPGPSLTIEKSMKNLKHFKSLRVDQLSVFALLKYTPLIFTKESFELIQKRYF